jgi:hypothetical protein
MPSAKAERHRAPSHRYAEAIRTREIVRPYLKEIGAWQLRAAFIGARLTSPRCDPGQRDEALRDLLSVRSNIAVAREAIRKVIGKDAPSDRVSDVLSALERLDGQLLELLPARGTARSTGETPAP